MRRKKPSGKNTDALLRGLFFLYCLVMVWLLFAGTVSTPPTSARPWMPLLVSQGTYR